MTQARDLADVAAGQTVAGATPSGGLVLIEKKTVAQGSASTTAFDFTNCFSSSFDVYQVEFDITRNGDSGAKMLFASFSNADTRLTNDVFGQVAFDQVGTSGGSGKLYFQGGDGVHQLMGGLGDTGSGNFRGTAKILNPNSTSLPNQIIGSGVMSQFPTSTDGDSFFHEDFLSSDEQGDLAGTTTDVLFGIITGNGSASNILFSATQVNVFGTVSIFGVQGL